MRVLIAEDDEISRLLLGNILAEDPAIRITPSADGTAAWAALQESGGFDLAIFDVMMPGLSGLELLARIRGDRRFATMPVILCTALNDRATVTQAVALEIDHYIVKPLSRTVVLEKVRQISATRTAADALEASASVCARLGIPRENWEQMLRLLGTNVADWISEAQQVLRTEELKALALRANALKGACVNLGAIGLATQLGVAEVGIGDLEANAPSHGFMSDPIVFSELASLAAGVQRESARFQQALNALGGP